MTGCITADMIGSKIRCLACNLSANYRLSISLDCTCSEGLSEDGGVCRPICGDSKLYLNEECDDGNNVDGDGCSSICLVEKQYSCENGSASVPSSCFYTSSLSIHLSNIEKEESSNVAIFKFSFSPAPSFLNKINFSDSLTFVTVPAH
jgi:cysteine-rich repeat protein